MTTETLSTRFTYILHIDIACEMFLFLLPCSIKVVNPIRKGLQFHLFSVQFSDTFIYIIGFSNFCYLSFFKEPLYLVIVVGREMIVPTPQSGPPVLCTRSLVHHWHTPQLQSRLSISADDRIRTGTGLRFTEWRKRVRVQSPAVLLGGRPPGQTLDHSVSQTVVC